MRQHVAAATLPAAIVPEAEYTFDLPAEPGRLSCMPISKPAPCRRLCKRLRCPSRMRDAAFLTSRPPTGFGWWWRPITPGRPRSGAGRKVGGCGVSYPISCAPSCRSLTMTPLRSRGSAARDGFTYAAYSPNQAVLGALERHVAACGLSSELRRALEHLLGEMTKRGAPDNVQGRKLQQRCRGAARPSRVRAGNTVPLFKPKGDEWGTAVMARLAAMAAEVQGPLNGLLSLAAQGGQNAKPAKGWLKSATKALERPDRARLGEHLLDLIECHEPGTHIALENQETLRALLWLAAMAAPEQAARRFEAFARTCLTFSAAHFAYLSLVLGNASIHAFTLMPGTSGVGSLMRLRRRLKRPGEIKAVDKALAALAQARGMSAGELEEIGAARLWLYSRRPPRNCGRPGDRGADDHRCKHARDDLACNRWNAAQGTAGRGQGQPCRCAERAEGARQGDRRNAKSTMRTASSGSISNSGSGRSTSGMTRYLDEPLVARMARRLIWSFKLGETLGRGAAGGRRRVR